MKASGKINIGKSTVSGKSGYKGPNEATPITKGQERKEGVEKVQVVKGK